MIGNDIIDLIEAQVSSSWQRRGFLEKVFSLQEQEVIHRALDPFQTVWRMWSMKESAYKFYLQKYQHAVRGFYPAKINCTIKDAKAGQVLIQEIQLNTKTIYHQNYLFSTAFSKSNFKSETEIFYLKEKDHPFQSNFTKEKLLNFIAKNNQVDKKDLTIKKTSIGAPQIFYKSTLLPLSCSITHHGNYGGFSVSFK